MQPWLGHRDYLKLASIGLVNSYKHLTLPAPAACARSIARNQRAVREHVVPFEPLDPSELIWGGRAIARAIGRTEAATFNALERGRAPGARRVGVRWALHVPSFRAVASEPTGTGAPSPMRGAR